MVGASVQVGFPFPVWQAPRFYGHGAASGRLTSSPVVFNSPRSRVWHPTLFIMTVVCALELHM